mmetsp:Transcript_31040/g.79696  ORF Transcript_31040/g.79696 Transcript_31040/m.79696 type:complete len:554 (+) Transcript_31040:334-1995(+)
MTLTAVRVCVLVEATAPMGYYFDDLRRDWLEPTLRACKKHHTPLVEFGLVLFQTSKFSDFVVQRGRWTQDVDELCTWLQSIVFTGGCFQPTALTEALAEMVYMCKTHHNFVGKTLQCHGILLATTEPSRASLPWPYPTDPATLGSVNYLSLAKELKSSHHISLSLMQGGHNANLQHMFKQSQGSHYKEERRLLAPAQLYVHLSTHWPEAAQWLVERHGQGIVQKAGFMQPPGPAMPGAGQQPANMQQAIPQAAASAMPGGAGSGGLKRATALPTSALQQQQQVQPQAQQGAPPMMGMSPQQAQASAAMGMQAQQGQMGLQAGGMGTQQAGLVPVPQNMGQLQQGLSGAYVQPALGVQGGYQAAPMQAQQAQQQQQQQHAPLMAGMQPGGAQQHMGMAAGGAVGGQGMQQGVPQQKPDASKPQFHPVWQGTMAVNPKATRSVNQEPTPIFTGQALVQIINGQILNPKWPKLMVIKKFVSQENVRKYLESMNIDANAAPKVVFMASEVKNPHLMQEMVVQGHAAVLDLAPHILILQFKPQNRMVGILIANTADKM